MVPLSLPCPTACTRQARTCVPRARTGATTPATVCWAPSSLSCRALKVPSAAAAASWTPPPTTGTYCTRGRWQRSMQCCNYPQVLIGGCHVDSSRDVPTIARYCVFRYDVDFLVPDVHGVTVTVTVESQVRPSCLFHPTPPSLGLVSEARTARSRHGVCQVHDSLGVFSPARSCVSHSVALVLILPAALQGGCARHRL